MIRWGAAAVLCVLMSPALAHDQGQWENANPEVMDWYRSLMQPDAPNTSCCGEADAYWADEIHVRNGKTYAKITDDRPDEPFRRLHRPVGTEFEIPNNKLKWDRGNPTGHNILFVGVHDMVFCFVQNGGI